MILRELEMLKEDMEDDCPLRYISPAISDAKAHHGRPTAQSFLLQRRASSHASSNLV